MRIAILTGAGVSRESGLKTFRDEDGLWAGYRIEDVCTPYALREDPQRVFDFYNMRRREILAAQPNAAHFALASLDADHDVTIVTQNIDDLHERSGSRNVIHIHGEALKARSIDNFDVVVPVLGDFSVGDLAPDGAQLRPHICFFHETPYAWDEAAAAVERADILVIVGTSLQVYPAAGLVDITRAERIVLIDPNPPRIGQRRRPIDVIAEPASTGVPKFVASITENRHTMLGDQ